MKAKPKPTTHHRSHQKTSSVPLARTGYGPKTGRSQCLLGDKFRHQYPPDYPGKEGSALLTPVCPGDFMVHINSPNHFEPQKDTQLPTSASQTCLGRSLNSVFCPTFPFCSPGLNANLLRLRIPHYCLGQQAFSAMFRITTNCWRLEKKSVGE